MLKLVSKITLNEGLESQLIFNFVNEINIESSWENLTDTCKITIPRSISFKGESIVIGSDALIKRGDKIKVELGYDDVLKEAFRGYVSRVYSALPIVLECEDDMYLLKKNILTPISYETVSLATLLKHIIPPGVNYTTNGFTYTNLGKIKIGKFVNTAMILELIRKENKVYSYFRNGTLYVGLAYQTNLRNTRNFDFEKNIIEDKGLEWTTPEDAPIRVRGVSIQSNNDVREFTFPSPDADGDVETISIPNQGQLELEALVKRRYEALQYEGYRGSFLTFGEPFVNHGDAVRFTSAKLPERKQGEYLIRSVKRSFDQGGYRQQIEVANKI